MDNKKKRENILVKVICVLIAFGLWLYIATIENPIRTNKINGVPVQIINEDSLDGSKLTILPGQEFKVNITIEGPASEVYKAKADQFRIVADLSGYAVKKGSNPIPVQIDQYPSNINIKRNEALRVNIELDELAEKSVPIKLDMDITTKSGFYSLNSVTKPDTALVSGAAKFVNQVEWVVAKGEMKNAEQDINISLPLKAVDEAMRDVKEVKVNPNVADIIIPVRKAKNVGINIKTKGELGKNLIMKAMQASPDRVNIAGEDAIIKNIEALDTEPIDLSSINSSKDISAKLILPKGVNLVNIKDIITVKINLESVSQKNMTVGVNVTGLNDTLKATLEKDKLSVVIQGPQGNLDAMKEEDITANIDLTNLGEGDFELAPKVTIKDGASLVSTSPQKIKVKVSKKESKP